jgi:hypothetical protein
MPSPICLVFEWCLKTGPEIEPIFQTILNPVIIVPYYISCIQMAIFWTQILSGFQIVIRKPDGK